jgi:hypothetical protein
LKFWHLVVGGLALWLIFGQGEDTKRSPSSSGGRGYYHAPYSYPSVPSGRGITNVDEIDCTVLNTTTGHGPYSLTCEIDGDDVKIIFPNGGFIIVDLDGYHDRTGDYWDVELD